MKILEKLKNDKEKVRYKEERVVEKEIEVNGILITTFVKECTPSDRAFGYRDSKENSSVVFKKKTRRLGGGGKNGSASSDVYLIPKQSKKKQSVLVRIKKAQVKKNEEQNG